MSNQNGNPPRGTPANKMLIDATHPEETRVVVLRNGRVEEFDYESAARKLLRGNIYLAKVTRVEPSLQAAFVDYGGNRHGFLAFNEIHPDYYQIPVADRRALLEAEAAAEAEEEAAADRAAEAAAARRARRREREGSSADDPEANAIEVSEYLPPELGDDDRHPDEQVSSEVTADRDHHHDDHHGDHERGDTTGHGGTADLEPRSMSERSEPDPRVSEHAPAAVNRPDDSDAARVSDHGHGGSDADQPETVGRDEPRAEDRNVAEHADEHASAEAASPDHPVETVDSGNGPEPEQIETVAVSEDVLEEVPVRPRRRLRSYKIQEVTKRRQVLLVQVVKEERGTKGAALTTYLSLAGRYTVLMPNTARGGGISRKITNPQDRKRLKAIAAELDVPEGMGLIIRTAGASRTKQEIKRDYEYLLRLWESVRELALNSNAPALVYEEGNLIKRSIRDLYGKEVDEIIVAGEPAYVEARDFMRMLMPSHAKNVIHFDGSEPLFSRYGIERQLNAMFSPYVHLRSGGYLVINQTEALVAIDINSGKSTREFSIEETAYSTNMEAADEIARQVKLRDLAGLIVIDFIDMEEKRNNRAVERRLKDALRHDRARIQLGRISHFGLLEMSRQRMRTGVVEGSSTQCPHCQGTGIVRSTESVALAVLRGLEDALNVGNPASLTATTTATVALYILNNKRAFIQEMEDRHHVTIQIQASEKVQGANFTIDRQARRDEPQRRPATSAVNMDWGFEDGDTESGVTEAPVADDDLDDVQSHEEANGSGDGNRRRRRRRRGRRSEGPGAQGRSSDDGYGESDGESDGGGGVSFVGDDGDDEDQGPRRDDRNRSRDRNRGHRDRDHRDGDSRRDRDRDRDRDQRTARTDHDDRSHATGSGDGEPPLADGNGDVDAEETAGREGRHGAEGNRDGERSRRRRRRGRRGGRRGSERDEGRGPAPEGYPLEAAAPGDFDPGVTSPSDDGGSNLGRSFEGAPYENGGSEAVQADIALEDHPRSHDATEPHEAETPQARENGAHPSAGNGHAAHDEKPFAASQSRGESLSELSQSNVQSEETRPAALAAPAEEERTPPPPATPAVVAASEPAADPVPPRRNPPVASEPVIERLVVSPDQTTTAPADEAPKPARRGWWQRR